MPVPQDKAIVSRGEGGFSPLEPGLYAMQIADIRLLEDVEAEFEGEKTVKDYLMIFAVVLQDTKGDESRRGEIIAYRISKSFNAAFEGGSSSKLYELANAVHNTIMDDGEPFDINELICGLFIAKIDSRKSNSGRSYTKITKTAPIGKLEAESLNQEETAEVMERANKIYAKISNGVSQSSDETDEDSSVATE